MKTSFLFSMLFVCVLALASCSDSPTIPAIPENPLLPLKKGNEWNYKISIDGVEVSYTTFICGHASGDDLKSYYIESSPFEFNIMANYNENLYVDDELELNLSGGQHYTYPGKNYLLWKSEEEKEYDQYHFEFIPNPFEDDKINTEFYFKENIGITKLIIHYQVFEVNKYVNHQRTYDLISYNLK